MQLFNNLSPEALRKCSYLENYVFIYAYDKTYTYGVNFKDVDLTNLGEPNEEMFGVLDCLASREITGHEAVRVVEDFAHDNGDLIKLICNKHLRIGMAPKTLNQYLPIKVPTFEVQLAKEVAIDKIRFPVVGQLKVDGVRLICIKRDGPAKFFTRNGLEVPLPAIQKTLTDLPQCVLDCEIVFGSGLSVNRTSISGAINSAMKNSNSLVTGEGMTLHVFDILSVKEWDEKKCITPYEARARRLKEFYSTHIAPTPASKYIALLPLQVLNSKEEVLELFSEVVAGGYEGLILKTLSHTYKFKRSSDWIKLKMVQEVDLKCIGVKEGTNRNEGLIGALSCEGVVNGYRVKVDVGAGLTDDDRHCSPATYIGKTIEVKYNDIIKDKNGNYSLFLPRFVRVRYDK